jgi:hypothetical protein
MHRVKYRYLHGTAGKARCTHGFRVRTLQLHNGKLNDIMRKIIDVNMLRKKNNILQHKEREQIKITELQEEVGCCGGHICARRPSTCWDGKAGTYPGLVQARPGTTRHVPRLVPGAYPGSARQQADERRGEEGGEGGVRPGGEVHVPEADGRMLRAGRTTMLSYVSEASFTL